MPRVKCVRARLARPAGWCLGARGAPVAHLFERHGSFAHHILHGFAEAFHHLHGRAATRRARAGLLGCASSDEAPLLSLAGLNEGRGRLPLAAFATGSLGQLAQCPANWLTSLRLTGRLRGANGAAEHAAQPSQTALKLLKFLADQPRPRDHFRDDRSQQHSLFGRTVPAPKLPPHDAIVFSAGDGAIAGNDTIY